FLFLEMPEQTSPKRRAHWKKGELRVKTHTKYLQAIFIALLSAHSVLVQAKPSPAQQQRHTRHKGPYIATQPANQAVTEGQTATFFAQVTGAIPLQYQWKQNGATIVGATSSSYTTPATTRSI